MADIKIQQTRVALNTSTGTQNITIGGLGTPKAAMFFLSQASTDDTIAADSALSIGFTDGTDSNAVGIHNADGMASADTDRWMSGTGKVLSLPDTTALYAEAAFSSWITDGVQINITTAPATGLLLTVVFIGGADVLNVKSFLRDLQSSTAAQNYTGIGFETDICFLAHNYNSTGSNGLIYSPLGFGCFVNDVAATPTQKSICWESTTGSANGAQAAYADDNAALCATLVGAYRWSLTISDIDSTGFTHTNSGSTGTDMIGLAVEVAAGASFDLFDVSIPTAGNYSKTGLSFEPTFGVMGLIQGPTAYNTVKTSAPAASFAISTFDASSILTMSATDEDGSADTVCKSLSSDQFRMLDYQGSADAFLASGYSLDSNGWTYTLTTNPAAAILGWAFAFSSGGASTPTDITPGIGTISAAGLSPVLTAPVNVAPGIGSTALSGGPVSVEAVSVVAPDSGNIAMSGLVPTVSAPADVSPGVGSVALSGAAVDVEGVTVVDPAVADIAITGSPVTVESPANIQPGQGTYAVTGIAVSVLTSVEIAPALGSTALTGFDLSVLADVDIAVGIGSLSLNGFSVTVDDEQTTSINPGAGSIALAGEIVGLSAVSDLTPGIGSLALSGEAVSVESGFTLSPGLASITCAGMAVTLDAITSGGLQHIGLPMLVMNKPTAVESLNYPVVQTVSFRTRLQIK
ncbi:MAG: hypothetical protein ABJM39_09645 [Porticoccus sp.]|uniref:hypothetical protein n=1 Tax=Porticoccus sp. TaxID=2024853 RepID=UPI003297F572